MLSKKKVLLILFIAMSIVGGAIMSVNNPVEELRKQQDDDLQVNAAEFIRATVVYYSAHGGLPWFSREENGVGCLGNSTEVQSIAMPALEECVRIMVSESELRPDFLNATLTKSLVVTNPNPETGGKLDTVVCFKPQSRTWQQDSNTHFNQDGTTVNNNRCISQGGRDACYWCTQ